MTTAAAQTGRMYCRKCSYDLRLLPSNCCPECGREFDPDSPKTFRRRPRSKVWPWVPRIVIVLILLAAPPAGAYGWLWWGWHSEEQTLAALGSHYKYRKGCPVNVRPIGPPWLAEYLGRRAYILNRVEFLYVFAGDNPRIPLLKKFSHLQELRLHRDVDASALSNLVGLKDLARLYTGRITGPPEEIDRQFLRLASMPSMKELYAEGVSPEARNKAASARADLKLK